MEQGLGVYYSIAMIRNPKHLGVVLVIILGFCFEAIYLIDVGPNSMCKMLQKKG